MHDVGYIYLTIWCYVKYFVSKNLVQPSLVVAAELSIFFHSRWKSQPLSPNVGGKQKMKMSLMPLIRVDVRVCALEFHEET